MEPVFGPRANPPNPEIKKASLWLYVPFSWTMGGIIEMRPTALVAVRNGTRIGITVDFPSCCSIDRSIVSIQFPPILDRTGARRQHTQKKIRYQKKGKNGI